MKKLFLIIVLAVLGISARAQAVSDMAVIPIGVTLNSIARLTVTSGGNIEFVVNTMDQYENGVDATSATTTTFSVSSSTRFTVNIQADNNELKPTTHTYVAASKDANDNPIPSNGIPVEVIEYTASAGSSALTPKTGDKNPLSTTAVAVFEKEEAGNYTNLQLAWSLAKKSPAKTLTKYTSDRYVVNAYLQLLPNQSDK